MSHGYLCPPREPSLTALTQVDLEQLSLGPSASLTGMFSAPLAFPSLLQAGSQKSAGRGEKGRRFALSAGAFVT